MEVRIVDADTGAPVPAGAIGMIQIRGPHTLRGICRRSREELFTADGFYPTGDLGHLDDDGFMFYHGRSDDMFKVSGATVYPSEVEQALRTIDGVDGAFVTNVSRGGGDRVGAVGGLRHRRITAEQLARRRAKDVLSSFKVPTVWLLAGLRRRDPARIDRQGRRAPAARHADRGSGGSTMKTKGALIWDFNQPWSVEEIEIGDPRKGEVKVALEVGRDVPLRPPRRDRRHSRGGLPRCSAATRAPVSSSSRRRRRAISSLGDHVAAVVHPVLRDMPVVPGRSAEPVRPRDGSDVRHIGVRRDLSGSGATARMPIRTSLLGTFSPYVVVHRDSVVKIDPTVPFEAACLVSCGVTTGYGSAVRAAAVRPGDDVAVVGLGGVGMSALQGAVNAGARRVFAVDPVEWKRDQALKFGATHAYPDVETALAAIADVTAGRMATR